MQSESHRSLGDGVDFVQAGVDGFRVTEGHLKQEYLSKCT